MAEGCDVSAGLKTRDLLNSTITCSAALRRNANILHELGYVQQRHEFFSHLWVNRKLIKSLIARHLGLASLDLCRIMNGQDLIHGSFNVCFQCDIFDLAGNVVRQVMIRFPLPYRIGESPCPGNADEKVRCEVGTYAWLKENCPTVPIPQLYGFGLSKGKIFTDLDRLPFFTRVIHRLRRWLLQTLHYPVPSFYVDHRDENLLGTPYILIEYIDPSRGVMLSETWEEGRSDPTLRANLFRSLSRIMLNLARIPLPRIGSFTIDENGYLSLSNRPLCHEIHQLENENIPVGIPRDSAHNRVDSFIYDSISLHEARLRYQPNAVQDLQDGIYQASILTVMRSIWPCFFRREYLRGPFFLNLTDLHRSNMFVDKDWNIVCLIDLEWACSHPVEMIHPPYWLTGQDIEHVSWDKYQALYAELMDAFAEEDKRLDTPSFLYPIIKQGIENGTFWYTLALNSPYAFFEFFEEHIQPRFERIHEESAFWEVGMSYWSFNTPDFIRQRVKDGEEFDVRLRQEFEC